MLPRRASDSGGWRRGMRLGPGDRGTADGETDTPLEVEKSIRPASLEVKRKVARSGLEAILRDVCPYVPRVKLIGSVSVAPSRPAGTRHPRAMRIRHASVSAAPGPDQVRLTISAERTTPPSPSVSRSATIPAKSVPPERS